MMPGFISTARLEGMTRERERGTEGGGGRRIIFYHSPLFLPTLPPLTTFLTVVYTSLRGGRYVETPSNHPRAAAPRTQSLFHPFLAAAAAEGGGWRAMPLHCTGWGSLLRARRAGDLGANARNRSEPPPPPCLPCLTRGCNAPYDSPLLLLEGVDTVRDCIGD